MKRLTIGSLFIVLILMILPQQFSCKKIDLKREVLVLTEPAENISTNSATLTGNIVDPGEDNSFSEYGFVFSTNGNPDIDDQKIIVGNSWDTGSFESQIAGLTGNTTYFFRSYVSNDGSEIYGNTNSFTTEQSSGPVSEWLHYDDGQNADGIGLIDGGSFDVVIRFTPQQLLPYDGLPITKFRIFVREGDPVEYYVEIFEGSNPTIDDLAYDQFVESPNIMGWTEVELEQPYFINASQEIWVGYYVSGAPARLYPAGIYDGPAETGFGDIIGTGDPIQWGLLSDGGFDANWNIQVFVTNEDDKEIPMKHTFYPEAFRNSSPAQTSGFTSSKSSNQ
jgi:hypothetical protein